MKQVDPRNHLCQHFVADSDPNGNSRRIWAHYRISGEGVAITMYDEESKGKPVHLRGVTQLPQVSISVLEYRSLLKNYELGRVV